MSGARMTGSMPSSRQIMGTIDTHARKALSEASRVVLPIVRAEAPGSLGRVMEASVRKTPTGHRLTVQAAPRRAVRDATAAQVVRWVNRGTGVYRRGPGPKRSITGKRGVLGTMTLPGGRRVRSVKGQRPNPFVARAEVRAMPVVERTLRQGAEHAADALRRL